MFLALGSMINVLNRSIVLDEPTNHLDLLAGGSVTWVPVRPVATSVARLPTVR
jgi:hypothetical protein